MGVSIIKLTWRFILILIMTMYKHTWENWSKIYLKRVETVLVVFFLRI